MNDESEKNNIVEYKKKKKKKWFLDSNIYIGLRFCKFLINLLKFSNLLFR